LKNDEKYLLHADYIGTRLHFQLINLLKIAPKGVSSPLK